MIEYDRLRQLRLDRANYKRSEAKKYYEIIDRVRSDEIVTYVVVLYEVYRKVKKTKGAHCRSSGKRQSRFPCKLNQRSGTVLFVEVALVIVLIYVHGAYHDRKIVKLAREKRLEELSAVRRSRIISYANLALMIAVVFACCNATASASKQQIAK